MADGRAKPIERTEVERIVRRVLASLAAGHRATKRHTETGSELVLAARVVSLADIEDRVDGISRIVVPRGAVITPAARDELKKRSVAVASDASRVAAESGGRLLIAVAETNHEPAALERMLKQNAISCERLTAGDLIATVDVMAERVAAGAGLGLLLTENTAAAVCLANRRPAIRAALGHSLAAVADAVRTVAVNLLVVDPRDRNPFELKQMVHALMRAANQPCSQGLSKRLG